MSFIRAFLRPESRKILLFLAIPVCMVIFIFSDPPRLFPVGSSSSNLVIPQILLGVFLILVTAPFSVVTAIFNAFGIDLFYTTGVTAKIGITIGIIATVFWWYIVSCLVISIYNRFKR